MAGHLAGRLGQQARDLQGVRIVAAQGGEHPRFALLAPLGDGRPVLLGGAAIAMLREQGVVKMEATRAVPA